MSGAATTAATHQQRHFSLSSPSSSSSKRSVEVKSQHRALGIILGILFLLHFFVAPSPRRTTTSSAKPSTSSALPLFLVQSLTNGNHNANQKRTVLSFTTVPGELSQLVSMVKKLLLDERYNVFDAIHINIPWTPMRFRDIHFPHSQEILNMFSKNTTSSSDAEHRIIVNRLMDHGPMTRYFGALGFEKHPETIIIVYDIDTDQGQFHTLQNLIRASRELDPNALWCNYGEDFSYLNGRFAPFWYTYDAQVTPDKTLVWNQVYFCRGSRGLLIKPKFFARFSLNATDYHHSCFWDDDRFISFQMAVMGISRKNIHPFSWYTDDYLPHRERLKKECDEKKKQRKQSKNNEAATNGQNPQRRRLGTLSAINNVNKPDVHCTNAYITTHPNLFPLASNRTFHCEEEI